MYLRPIVDLFYPQCPKPTFDLCLTNFTVFGARGPLGGLLLLHSKGNLCLREEDFPQKTS